MSGYQALVESALSGVVAVDDGGRIHAFNRAAEDMFGYRRDKVLGLDIDTLLPRSLQPAESELREGWLLPSNPNPKRNIVARRSNGDVFPVELTVTSLVISGQHVKVLVLRDLAEKVEAERKAQQSETLLETVLEGITDPVFIKGADGRYVKVNSAAANVLRTDRLEMVGQTIYDVVPPDVAATIVDIDRRVMAGESVVVDKSSRIGGQMRYFDVVRYPLRDLADEVTGIVGIWRDITTRCEIEKELRQSEERLSLALDAAGAGYWSWDAATDTVHWSDHAFEICGSRIWQGMTINEWIDTATPETRQQLREGVSALLTEKLADHRLQYQLEHPELGLRTLVSMGRSSYGPDNRPTRSVGLIFDMTDSQVLEQETRDARERAEQADRAKTRFLAAASHDLRQPIQSLFMFASSLRGEITSDAGRDNLSHLEQSISYLGKLVDSLLDISCLDAQVVKASKVTFPLSRLIEEIHIACDPIAIARGLRLNIGDCSLSVLSDPTLLTQMVRNLVENALRYTREGEVNVSCKRDNDHAIIAIDDTGIGIAPEHLESIWEEFHQLNNPDRDRTRGIGLGLPIVRRLSALLDHPVTVTSTPGIGSTFTVRVPLAASESPSTGRRDMAATSEPRRDRLAVVIDDDTMVLLSLRAFLLSEGYRVIVAESGDEAMEALSGEAHSPDILLADYRLRNGETGIQAIARVRAAAQSFVPAAILTGETGEKAVMEAAADGIGVLHKPLAPAALTEALARLSSSASG